MTDEPEPLDRLALSRLVARTLAEHDQALDVGTPEPGRVEVRTAAGTFDVWVREKGKRRRR